MLLMCSSTIGQVRIASASRTGVLDAFFARFAREARQVVDEARDLVAGLLGCAPGEVIFTGSGTEADNMAIFGAVRRRGGVLLQTPLRILADVHVLRRDWSWS